MPDKEDMPKETRTALDTSDVARHALKESSNVQLVVDIVTSTVERQLSVVLAPVERERYLVKKRKKVKLRRREAENEGRGEKRSTQSSGREKKTRSACSGRGTLPKMYACVTWSCLQSMVTMATPVEQPPPAPGADDRSSETSGDTEGEKGTPGSPTISGGGGTLRDGVRKLHLKMSFRTLSSPKKVPDKMEKGLLYGLFPLYLLVDTLDTVIDSSIRAACPCPP
uniref:Uncharacterized protein n=1 Tax=Timema monikensis TaxID=170555 RepID=A0A7R9E852_9NEOP|nr:unnamed protein product [Timema monikensis]